MLFNHYFLGHLFFIFLSKITEESLACNRTDMVKRISRLNNFLKPYFIQKLHMVQTTCGTYPQHCLLIAWYSTFDSLFHVHRKNLHSSRLSLHYSRVRLQDSDVNLQDSKVSLHDSKVSIQCSKMSLQNSKMNPCDCHASG